MYAAPNSDKLAYYINLHNRLDQQRRFYLPMWQEIADRLLPDQSNILRIYSPGGKRTQWMFDSTAPLALQKYAAAMESMLTPRTQRWHGLRARDEELNEIPEVQEYFDELTDILFKVRYAPLANFAQQTNECYIGNGAYGNAALFVDDLYGRGIRYRSLHIAELFFAENFQGIVDVVHRQFKMSLKQAYERFVESGDGTLPPHLIELYNKGKDLLTEFTFIHCVHPNPDYKKGAIGLKGMKYTSTYICWDEPYICRDGNGYRAFPYAISRHLSVAGDVYARGPASLVLPDIKQLNEMEKVNIRQAQLAADPSLLMYEDGNLSGFNVQPGAFIWGGVNADGKPMVQPLQTGANFQVSLEMQDGKRKVVQDAFLVTLFQILIQNPEMTATEALLRAQEKGQLLAPTMGRQQSEFQGPIIERELEILDAAGMLPQPPSVLAERGVQYEVEYTSPLNRAQQSEEGVGIMNTLNAAAAVAQVDQGALVVFQGKGPEIIRRIARINGMHTKLLNTEDEALQKQEQAQQAAQMERLLQAAPIAAGAAKDFASAQQMSAPTPQSEPMVLPGARA